MLRCRHAVSALLVSLGVCASAQADRSFVFGSDGPTVSELKAFDILDFTQTASAAPFGSFSGGVRVAACDVNGDGTTDRIAAAGPGGTPTVTVYNGRTGAVLRSFNAFAANFSGGVFVAAADFDGDGRCEIIVSPDETGAPEVKIFRGRDNQVIADFFVYTPSFNGGVRVAAADVNGDGHPDLIVAPGTGMAPEVKVFDGTNITSVLRDFFAYATSFNGGVYVAAVDTDGDGKAEIIVGPGSGAPRVNVFSGADGEISASYLAYDANAVGGVRVGAGDGDGLAKIVTATGRGTPTNVVVEILVSPPITQGFLPYGNASSDGGFAAVAPRNDVIFADGLELQ